MNPPESRTVRWPHHRTAVIVAALVVVAGLVVLPWESATDVFIFVFMVLGGVYLLYLVWAMATGRVGMIHRAAAPRRRLAARAASREARLEQQRLDAAMSYGSYRPTAGRAQDRDRPSGEELRA